MKWISASLVGEVVGREIEADVVLCATMGDIRAVLATSTRGTECPELIDQQIFFFVARCFERDISSQV